MSSFTYEPNVGLLDMWGTAQVLHTLSARFRAVEFADWCTIAEEIVLRDYIVLVGKFDLLPRHLKLALRPYVEAGVFRLLREAVSLPELPTDQSQLQATMYAIEQGLTATTPGDATREARRLLGAEAHTGLAATPLLRQMQHYGLVRRPALETMIWDLAAQYRSLSDALRDVRRRYQTFANLPTISIPPIALRAVSRARHFDRLFAELMQIRDEFAQLRSKMRDLQEQLTGGRLSPGEAVALEKSWRDRWQSVADTSGVPSALALARTSSPLLRDATKVVLSAAKQDVLGALHAVVGCIGSSIAAVGSMQLRPVHRSVSNYMRTRDPEIKSSVARLFQYDFVRLDADMNSLATQPGNPWRLALQHSEYQAPKLHGTFPRHVVRAGVRQSSMSLPTSGRATNAPLTKKLPE